MVQVYIPGTLEILQQLEKQEFLSPVMNYVFGITPELREEYNFETEEELAYVAFNQAALASLRLIASDLESCTDAPEYIGRVVVTAEIEASCIAANLDDAVMRVSENIQIDQVQCFHIDGRESHDVILKAVQNIDAADLGDEDALIAVGNAEDISLLWYANQELSILLELL